MRLQSDGRTARAIILSEAFRAFAERGSDVTIREIASAAGVSPALVIRHYGSKQQLLDRLDDEVVESIGSILDSIVVASSTPADSTVAGFDPGAQVATGIGAVLAEHLPADSPIPAYLTRLLVDNGGRGATLFARLFEASEGTLAALVAAGAASPGTDPRVRAMVLLVADLATIMLRPQISVVLGVDPLSPDGLVAWGREVLSIHRGGLSHE